MKSSGTVRRGTPVIAAALLGALLAAGAQGGLSGESLSLAEAIEEALDRNAVMEAARREARAAEARIGEARGALLPRLSLAAGYTRYEEANVVLPIHEAGVFPPLDDAIYAGAAVLEVPLFDGGRGFAEMSRAKARRDEAIAVAELTETELLLALGKVYVGADELEDRRGLLEARLEVLKRQREELRRLQVEGRIAPSDLGRLTSAIERVRADSIEMENRSFELAVRLGRLVGREDPIPPEPSGSPGSGGALDAPPERPAESRGARLRRADAVLRGAEAARSLSRRAFWPSLDGFANYAVRSGEPPDPIGEWAVGISLRLPLFDGGRRIAALQAASGAEAAARARRRAEAEEQEAGALLAIDRWNGARGRREALGEAVRSTSDVVLSTRRLYEEGRVPLSDLLDEEAELLALEIDERSEAHAGRIARLEYYGALGLLDPERIGEILGGES